MDIIRRVSIFRNAPAIPASHNVVFWLLCLLFLICVPVTFCQYRYMGAYVTYGTGDTMVTLWHAHGGSRAGTRKWNAECLDGEAMVGIQDGFNDFETVLFMWCRFMFPHKPSTQGAYPYYPTCHVRNYRLEFFCIDSRNFSRTVNTFVTGLWDNEFSFYVFRTGTGFSGDDLQPYKCCKTPTGYYIDYVSCYYAPTHDQFFEYYDMTTQYLVYCNTGFVVTGLSKKRNPYETDYHLEWLQCCRLGYGQVDVMTPPVVSALSGVPTYSGSTQPVSVPSGYQSQYRSLTSEDDEKLPLHPTIHDQTDAETLGYSNGSFAKTPDWAFRYKQQPIPKRFNVPVAQGLAHGNRAMQGFSAMR